MELRTRSIQNLHHISAIKGGKVVKTLNVTRGKPSLSFKEMKTFIDHEGNTKPIALANRSLHKVDGLNVVKSEEETANDNYIDGSESSHDLDHIFLGEMTLKQLKKKCKAEKLKDPKSVVKEIKQEYNGSNPEGDDLDLEETLGTLKRKVSGKLKSRKMLKCGPRSKTTDVVKCESVSIGEKSLQVSSDIDMSATVKVEVSEPECSLRQDVASSEDFYSSEHEMISTGMMPASERQETGESCTKEKDSLIITEEPILSNADPVSCEHDLHNLHAQSLQEIPVCDEMVKVDDLGIIEEVTIGLPDHVGCLSGDESSLIAEEYQAWTLTQSCSEDEEHSGGSCLNPASSSHEEALKFNNPVMPVERSMLPASAQEDKAITDALTCNESPDILFPLCKDSAWNNDCKIYSHENKSQMHRSRKGGACPAMDGNKEDIISGSPCTSAISPNSGLDATARLELDSIDDTDKVPRSVASEKVECFEVHNLPDRLLSARKTISPNSQQKLCRAMNALDLPNSQKTEKCKQRICFDEQELNADTSSNIGRDQNLTSSAVSEHSNAADSSPNSEKKLIKGKEDKRRFRARGVNKTPPPSWYRLSSACGCIQSCSQNVIDFSKQQITDIDRLAVNLTKELRSMKELMIEMLQPQVRRSATSRYNMNEVRVAVENANKVEDMARRSLATMTRDCNRFCKIVSLAEKNASTVGNSPSKEEAENDAGSVENKPEQEAEADKNDASKTVNGPRKKIKFADESGGSLCNVRFIEDQDSVVLDSPVDDAQLHSA